MKRNLEPLSRLVLGEERGELELEPLLLLLPSRPLDDRVEERRLLAEKERT